MRRSVVVDHRQIKSFIQLGNIVWQKREARGNCLAAALILSIPYPKRGGDVAMPEWLDRALFCILVALAVLFVWGCIAGVLGAFSILIWIEGIAVIAGIGELGGKRKQSKRGRTFVAA
jgi:hypothetical protein